MLDYTEFLKKRLSDKRFEHSVNVSKECIKLAKIYNANPQKAELAGLLHDVTKEEIFKKQLKMIKYYGMIMTEIEKKSPNLWHPISGAAFLKYKLNINDKDIINAVRYHTTGRGKMSLLEKIVFLADAISCERSYDGVEHLRRLAYNNLDDALAQNVSNNLKKLSSLRFFIEPNSIVLYNEIINKNKKKGRR